MNNFVFEPLTEIKVTNKTNDKILYISEGFPTKNIKRDNDSGKVNVKISENIAKKICKGI